MVKLFHRKLYVLSFLASAFIPVVLVHAADESLRFEVRKQVETAPDSGKFQEVKEQIVWNPKKTAVVICDMWDRHWCKGATARVAEMAPVMNEMVCKLRAQGALIIHAPSSTMDFYADTPQRKRAQDAPPVETEIPLRKTCKLDPEREPPLPIDDSDGGCDCSPPCDKGKAWSRQIDVIGIEDEDAITDSTEAFYLMKQKGIENVFLMGVHTNMCVLHRPFSIRQMCYQGQNVVLVRDMTDTMYNSRMPPFVSHFEGTDLVVGHIEKFWAPTTTSAAFLDQPEFHFKGDTRFK